MSESIAVRHPGSAPRAPAEGAHPAHDGRVNGRNGHKQQLKLFRPGGPWVDVELFAGAGGMSLGLSEVGAAPDHLVELNKHCCATLRHNSTESRPFITGTLHEQDVAKMDWGIVTGRVRVLSGGPPCQPFSLAGKHLAERDDRNEFPSTVAAIRALRPAAVLLENVHGLNRESFRPYLEYVARQIRCIEVAPKHDELWNEHDARLKAHESRSGFEPAYTVVFGLLNAADFGVPQTRSRLIIMATQRGLPAPVLPSPTHSMAALVAEQESGAYWDRLELPRPDSRVFPKGPPGYARDPDRERLPWVTVRECIRELPTPTDEDTLGINHWIIPGARLYRGHRGSELDWPSKTIKAGVHGVAGGENIIHQDDGSFRYFTLREMASLQGFPTQYVFQGPRSRIIGQIGNAVPCGLASVLANSLRSTLDLSVESSNEPLQGISVGGQAE